MLSLRNSASEAIPYFIKAASYTSTVKTSPQTYAYLAAAYEEGPYAKLADAYERTYSGKDEIDESRLALANINQIVDRIIDAYARAVALVGLESPTLMQGASFRLRSTVESPAMWLGKLTELYKYRHNASEAGLKNLIRTVLSTPLPPEPTPITWLPPRKK